MSEPTQPTHQPFTGPSLELPRLVMRRAAAVALLALGLAFVLGFWRSGEDIDDEIDGALALATTLAHLGAVAATQDDATLARTLAHQGPLRHVRLQLLDAIGRAVYQSPEPDRHATPWPARQLAALHAAWQGPGRTVQQWLPLPRPGGAPPWRLQVAGARNSERLEAMHGLAQAMALLALGSAAMLAVMALTLRHALAPLRSLVQAIGLLREQPAQAAATLAQPLPTRELQVVAQALLTLQHAQARDASAAQVLRRQVLTLQEDERQRLARELHDEFGQQLTALRADAAWLAQRLAAQPEEAQLAQGMAQRCGDIQQDIRALLTRLQPLAPAAGDDGAAEPAWRLAELLAALLGGWTRAGWARGRDGACSFELRLVALRADGQPMPWPRPGDPAMLPRGLALALYRMSQEALTNVARHAQAQRALLSLTLMLDAQQAVHQVAWELADDGLGLPAADALQALQRGSGLAGLKERAWAQGAELRMEPAWPGSPRPGLRLAAQFTLGPVA